MTALTSAIDSSIGGDVAHVALRVGPQVPLQLELTDGLRLALGLLETGEPLLSELFEFVGGERRLPENLGDEAKHGRQILARRFDLCPSVGRATEDVDARLQPIDLVLNLLACALRGSSHEHRAGELPGHAAVRQALLVAEAQRQIGHDRIAARLLGEQRHLEARRPPTAPCATRCSSATGRTPRRRPRPRLPCSPSASTRGRASPASRRDRVAASG